MKLQVAFLISGLTVTGFILQGIFSPGYSVTLSGGIFTPVVNGNAITINDYHANWVGIDGIYSNFRLSPSTPFTTTGGFTATETSSGIFTNSLNISFSPDLPLPDGMGGATTRIDYFYDCVGACLDLAPDNEVYTYNGTPVPEPLTILGSGMALGVGALFKKEYSRKQKR